MNWNELTRGQYIFWMIGMFIMPFLAGIGASVIQPWSDFWWDFTVKLFYIWSGWVIICALFGWQNHRFARIFPFLLLMNIGALLAMVPLWRVAEESIPLGWLLLSSHLIATLFAYIYSKEWALKDFSKVGGFGRFLIGLVILGPILWIITLISLDLFSVKVIKPIGAALCYYYLNIPLTAGSIRFRYPDWNPKKKVSL
jgi:hypothetical protein